MRNNLNPDAINKVLTGLKGARELLDVFITPELEEKMTEEQREQVRKAREMTDEATLKKNALDIMNSIKTK